MCQVLCALLLLPACGARTAANPTAKTPAPASTKGVDVYITGGDGITVAEYDGTRPSVDDGSWRQLCRTPCSPTLFSGKYYRVEGIGRADSDPVKLPYGSPISGSAKGGDSVPILIGSVLLVSAAAGALMAYKAQTSCDSLPKCSDSEKRARAALGISGLTLLLGGTVGGILSIQYGRETSLEFKVQR